MDLDAVRTFVAAADAGQFQESAAALSITQQAVPTKWEQRSTTRHTARLRNPFAERREGHQL
ncbi:hypothetical protein ACLMAL_26180 [Nocardia sp. CWNU-33]|uniref:hypothetical protein n=1 Tax=Nocardia sp. CWNU-33 TaxID=3392117 RepID=UPI00398E5BFF